MEKPPARPHLFLFLQTGTSKQRMHVGKDEQFNSFHCMTEICTRAQICSRATALLRICCTLPTIDAILSRCSSPISLRWQASLLLGRWSDARAGHRLGKVDVGCGVPLFEGLLGINRVLPVVVSHRHGIVCAVGDFSQMGLRLHLMAEMLR